MPSDTVDQSISDVSQNYQTVPASRVQVQGRGSERNAAENCSALADAVRLALSAAGYTALREVQVEVERGTAVLWGRVPSYHQKQVAQTIAQAVRGIRSVANGIEVDSRRSN